MERHTCVHACAPVFRALCAPDQPISSVPFRQQRIVAFWALCWLLLAPKNAWQAICREHGPAHSAIGVCAAVPSPRPRASTARAPRPQPRPTDRPEGRRHPGCHQRGGQLLPVHGVQVPGRVRREWGGRATTQRVVVPPLAPAAPPLALPTMPGARGAPKGAVWVSKSVALTRDRTWNLDLTKVAL